MITINMTRRDTLTLEIALECQQDRYREYAATNEERRVNAETLTEGNHFVDLRDHWIDEADRCASILAKVEVAKA